MTSTSVNPNHKLATSEFSNAIANDHNYSDADEKLILEIILNFLQKFPYLYDTLNVDFFAKKVYNKLDFEVIYILDSSSRLIKFCQETRGVARILPTGVAKS